MSSATFGKSVCVVAISSAMLSGTFTSLLSNSVSLSSKIHYRESSAFIMTFTALLP